MKVLQDAAVNFCRNIFTWKHGIIKKKKGDTGMLYTAKSKDGTITGAAISCRCGCDMLKISKCDDGVSISAYNSAWYSFQNFDIMGTKIRHIKNRLAGKKKGRQIVFDIVIDRSEMEEFIQIGKELASISSDIPLPYPADSHLAIDPLSSDGSEWLLEIRSDMPLLSMIRGKQYRCYEVCMTGGQWMHTLLKMERYMKRYTEKSN